MGASYGSGTFYLINPCVSLVIVYWVVILFLLPHLRPAHLPEIPISRYCALEKMFVEKRKREKEKLVYPVYIF